MNEAQVLAINPGSTSTKIAVFEGTTPLFIQTLRHSREELEPFPQITDQFGFRKALILKQLEDSDINLSNIRIVMGRGGLLKPVPSGVFAVNDRMLEDLKNCTYGAHASNLGGLIASDIARSLPDARAYIANPVVVDELSEVARLSGHPLLPRRSIFHALNQKAVAREHARHILKRYEDLNLIVVHLGGGITIGAHRKGKVVDVNQGLDGDGPYSPERSGTLPVGDLVRLCYSGKYELPEVLQMITGKGGLVAYLGTNSAQEVEQMTAEGNAYAELIYDGMAYQVAKEVGAMAAVLNFDLDGVIITGGIAHDKYFVNRIISQIHRLAPVHVYPGEDEMKALAMNGFRILHGDTTALDYS